MIRVYSNDSSNPIAQLTIGGQTNNSALKFELIPQSPSMGEVLHGKETRYKVELKNTDTLAVKLAVVTEPSSKYVKNFNIANNLLDPGESTPIEFDLQGDIPDGEFDATLTVEAKGHPEQRISIPVEGKVVDKYSQAQ